MDGSPFRSFPLVVFARALPVVDERTLGTTMEAISSCNLKYTPCIRIHIYFRGRNEDSYRIYSRCSDIDRTNRLPRLPKLIVLRGKVDIDPSRRTRRF